MSDRRDGRQTVKKWLPNSLSCMDRLESWFSDMAGEGLFPESIGFCRAVFRRDTPRKLRYRFDVRSGKLTEDQLGVYDACGWHLALLRQELFGLGDSLYFYLFETDENSVTPELHTDPMEQAASLRILERCLRRDFCLYILVMLALAVLPLRNASDWYRTLVYGPVAPSMVYILGWLPIALGIGLRWGSTRRLRKRLAEGVPLNHHAAYNRRWKYGAVSVAWRAGCGLLVLGWLVWIGCGAGSSSLTVPAGAPDFPAVRLEEVDGTPAPPGTLVARLNLERTIMGVRIYRLYESAGVDKGLSRLETSCYEMPAAWESRYVLEELLAGCNAPSPVDTTLVDEAWTEAGTDGRCLLVRDGRYVLHMVYTGKGELAGTLPLLAERLNTAD